MRKWCTPLIATLLMGATCYTSSTFGRITANDMKRSFVETIAAEKLEQKINEAGEQINQISERIQLPSALDTVTDKKLEHKIKELEKQLKEMKTAASTIENTKPTVWTEDQIASYMRANPNRAFFSRLFKDGGFCNGMEVGVAHGRFSEHFLKDLKSISGFQWTFVEPFPTNELINRYDPKTGAGIWKSKGLLEGVQHTFHKVLSLDPHLPDKLPDDSYDFIYLDGDHSYKGVRDEMPLFWDKVKKGGILAGHDYCNHGQPNLLCKGCEDIPRCQPYTEYGKSIGKGNGVARDQNGVVKAVQEWMMKNPVLTLHHTTEDFTRESLVASGMDYDLVITSTRNPSWFVVKPL